MEKLSVKGLAMGLGVAWSLCLLFSGWVAVFGWTTKFVELMGSVYIGYEPGIMGGLIGAAWGFVDGAIGGLIIAVTYNAVARK